VKIKEPAERERSWFGRIVGRGAVLSGRFMGWPTAALPARRPAVLASSTWFGRGQASDNDGRGEHQNLAVCKREKLTADLGARWGQREWCCWHESKGFPSCLYKGTDSSERRRDGNFYKSKQQSLMI
jgi:hypothetical protein